jgi:hypothetical protein
MVRGVLLILVAVALGVVLLRSTDRTSSFTRAASGGRAATTTTAARGASAVTTTTVAKAKAHNPAEVTILVANGSGKAGAAARVASVLKGSNFVLKESTNTKTPAAASVVYYAPGYELDAKAIAALLTPQPATQPLPNPLPVKDIVGAKVLVVVAADLAAGR